MEEDIKLSGELEEKHKQFFGNRPNVTSILAGLTEAWGLIDYRILLPKMTKIDAYKLIAMVERFDYITFSKDKSYSVWGREQKDALIEIDAFTKKILTLT